MLRLNVYGFSVQRKSQLAAGYHSGDTVAIVAVNVETARAALIAFVGADLAKGSGPTIIVEGALYDGSTPLVPPPGGEEIPATAPPTCTTTPYVGGFGTVGGTLNCTMGNWTGEPTSYAYQWKSDDETDVGTGPDYTVQASDAGHSLTCVVTASNALGDGVAPPSNPVVVGATRHKRG